MKERHEAQTHLIYPDVELSDHDKDLAYSSNGFHDVSSLSHAISSEELNLPGRAPSTGFERKLEIPPPGFKIGKL